MEVRIRTKEVYGRTMAYPANVAASALADIAGTRTLSAAILRRAQEALGAKVIVLVAGHVLPLTAGALADLLRRMDR